MVVGIVTPGQVSQMSADPLSWLLSQAALELVPVLHLFGGPFVTFEEQRIDIPEGCKRLLVFVALHGGPVDRRHAAGVLWPVGNDLRAAGNLRSALWRLQGGAGIPLLSVDKYSLTLRDDVLVDLRIVSEWTARLICGSASHEDLEFIPWGIDGLELLPGWYDDWALLERERVTQRVLHGLEVQSRRLAERGRCAEAIDAALVAVGADPLRESAQQALIEAHLAARNWAEARRRFEVYRKLVRRELGVEPSPQLSALVNHDANVHLGLQYAATSCRRI
jgi:DNA-binding SARP family transcriptional activator